MRISYTFRNMESSDAIKNHASDKIAKVQKYIRSPLHAEFTFSMERHLHRVDLTLTGDGHQYAGHGQSDDMYTTIDQVVDKIDRQVRDTKATETNRRRNSGESLRHPED
ncbi:MAG: ribosome-associated translation inhibitor RaiA [Deltaproteobacteria bacterium]|nr:ribosome-associated translation inhibitor RaiA [Deltaproteobacteria bacterium]NND29572.1 ribosome-associated translation inhibitor RaiA [Myxococcales bacterium]MBT8464208.1 ribosome-associated translation inhibitor RaiA [Deltaproteobacteria bacterium]MBT8481722.1 ribosome-associated translation inhibitor RaiA [Deltaproteobacteria bacterium]NNK06048.1 ribosome-associated translation inhibitor RaiA [Myxococcales bacterium]